MKRRCGSGLRGAPQVSARLAVASLVLFALALAAPRVAHADGFTSDEQAALGRGEVVKRELVFDRSDGRYVGGLSYVIIHAPVREVAEVLADTDAYTSILPLAKEARVVGLAGQDRLVELTHWTRIGTASYTVRIQRESPSLQRFWCERARPGDLDDCWGFFRVTRIDKDTSLFTYAAVMNLGFGFARMFFESRIQALMLTTPDLVRRKVEDDRILRPTLPGR